jgi:hypothetical protein
LIFITWWTDYQSRRGKDRKALYTDDMKNIISTEFKDSTSYHLVKINDIDTDVRIVDENAIEKQPNKKRMLSLPDETFNIGDIVIWNSENWLVTNIDADKNLYTKGTIEKCNNTLKFYNKTGLLWVEADTPCIITTPFKTGLGILEDKFVSSAKEEYEVQIPASINTNIIDIGHRFIVNNKAFLCEGAQNIVPIGLKTLKLTKDEFNPDDDKINGYADALKYANNFSIELISNPIVNLNTTSQIEIKCMINEVIDTSPTLLITNSNTNVCTINTSTLLVTYVGVGTSNINISYHGVSVSITVNGTLSPSHNYDVSITPIEINSIKLGQSKTFVAVFTNNGSPMLLQAYWTLLNDTETGATDLAIIKSTNGTYNENIIIEANSNYNYGYCKLIVKDISENISYKKRIQIISLM